MKRMKNAVWTLRKTLCLFLLARTFHALHEGVLAWGDRFSSHHLYHFLAIFERDNAGLAWISCFYRCISSIQGSCHANFSQKMEWIFGIFCMHSKKDERMRVVRKGFQQRGGHQCGRVFPPLCVGAALQVDSNIKCKPKGRVQAPTPPAKQQKQTNNSVVSVVIHI